MRKLLTTLCLWCAALTISLSVALAEAEKVPVDKLPKPVADAVKAKFPDGKVTGATKEEVDGKSTYSVTLTSKDKEHGLILTPEGKTVATKKEVLPRELPDKIARILPTKYVRGTNKKSMEVTKDKTVTYEILIETGDKRLLDVVMDPDGNVLSETERKKDGK